MILLFSADENWNIGYEGDVLLKISEDLKRFRKLTIENIIIMGRKTFESLPESKALDSRINIVVTRKEDYNPPNTVVVNSIEELFKKLEELNPDNKMENYVIGGGNLADQLLNSCHKAYITKIFKNFERADTSLHNLDKDHEWEPLITSGLHYQDDVAYQYVDYTRIKP
nr:dihydrofolate reductase [Tissierella sp.]